MNKKSTLTIGIPVDAALKQERTGVEEYTFQLVSHFLKIARGDSRYKFILYSSYPKEKVREIFPNAEQIVSSPYKRFWSQRVLPQLVLEAKPDILFSPSYLLPRSITTPAVVTIHGMEWYNFPEHYSLPQRLNLRLQTEKAFKNARGVIAVSEHTKRGIEDFMKETPLRRSASQRKLPIAVIPHGVDSPVRIPSKKKVAQKHWRILFVGRKDKRKNLKGMVEAMNIVQRLGPDTAFTFSAVGPLGNDPFAKKNYEAMQNTFVSEEEKTKHYKDAEIFLFPSHDEGFGMPILEAQSHGVPVVCSSFLKEVAGEGALYCEPNDSKSIASAVLTLMLHPTVYAKTRKNARANVKRFSWGTCASDTLSFLERIAEQG